MHAMERAPSWGRVSCPCSNKGGSSHGGHLLGDLMSFMGAEASWQPHVFDGGVILAWKALPSALGSAPLPCLMLQLPDVIRLPDNQTSSPARNCPLKAFLI